MNRKKIFSLFMAVVMLLSFSVSAFAAEANAPKMKTVELGESGMTMTLVKSDRPTPRTPGTAGLYSVVAAPARMATHEYAEEDFVANYGGNGRTSFLHVTLDDNARRVYQQIGADGYYVEVSFNLQGVTRYEVILNGENVGGSTCAGYDSGYLDLLVYDDRPAIWEVDLYDSTGAKMTWGHVNYM